MNIFYLDQDPKVCAQYHVDKHTVKMILEYAQLMSTAHHLSGSSVEGLYKPTHKNHPSAIWTRQSVQNYKWLYSLFTELCKEYTYRYGKVHKTQQFMMDRLSILPNIADVEFTEPTLCMPDDYKTESHIESYRQYYINEKVHIAQWKGRESPYWFKL